MAVRIEIEGRWSAADFAAFYKSVNDLYQFFLFDLDPFFLERGFYSSLSYRRLSWVNLEVEQITFASPGFTDLVGIAAAVRELREFIQFLITHLSTGEDRKLAREQTKLEIAEKKLELLKRLEEFPDLSPSGLEARRALLGVRSTQLPEIDPIIDAVIEGRVVGCKRIETKAEDPE